jgi:hypothetical protein
MKSLTHQVKRLGQLATLLNFHKIHSFLEPRNPHP